MDGSNTLPTLEELKKRTDHTRFRTAWVVMWLEVIYRQGMIISEFKIGSTLYAKEADAERAKRTAREQRNDRGEMDGIARLPAHHGSAYYGIEIPTMFHDLLLEHGPDDREFTTLDQWRDYYNRRSEQLKYYVIDAAEGYRVLMNPHGAFVSEFAPNVGNPQLIASLLNGHRIDRK